VNNPASKVRLARTVPRLERGGSRPQSRRDVGDHDSRRRRSSLIAQEGKLRSRSFKIAQAALGGQAQRCAKPAPFSKTGCALLHGESVLPRGARVAAGCGQKPVARAIRFAGIAGELCLFDGMPGRREPEALGCARAGHGFAKGDIHRCHPFVSPCRHLSHTRAAPV
jgi:hypothetical protein